MNRAAASAGLKSFFSAAGQNAKDAMFKKLTGKKRDHLSADGKDTLGHLRLGQEYMKDGAKRTATAQDVMQREKELALGQDIKTKDGGLHINGYSENAVNKEKEKKGRQIKADEGRGKNLPEPEG